MITVLDELDAEVQRLADEATPELLVRLLRTFLSGDRPGLITCERHSMHLFPYVRAQIDLTRAKRNYYRWADVHWPGDGLSRSRQEETYDSAVIRRDQIRKTYRSTPCTCWVPHR